MPTLNLSQNLNEQQRSSITNLLGSGRALNETDARNLAYATGQGNWQQFVGQSASNYNIGNLSQFVSPTSGNIDASSGSGFTIPGLGGSQMEAAGFTTAGIGMTQNEQALINLMQQREAARAASEKQAQSQYDQAYAGMTSAYDQEINRAEIEKQFKIDEQIQQLTNINNQLTSLTAAYQATKNAIGNQPINTAIIRGQQYMKQQEYAVQATVLASQGDIIQGNLDLAVQRAKNYYDDATASRKSMIDKYTTLLGLADDRLISLNKDEKDNIDAMISTLQGAEKRQTENKDKISALLLDPIVSQAWSKTPGLSLDMSFEEIVKKLQPNVAAINQAQFNAIHAKTGTGSSAAKIYTATNIPTDLKSEIIQNIANGATVNDLYLTYPDVSTEYINGLINSGIEVTPPTPNEETISATPKEDFVWWNPTTWF